MNRFLRFCFAILITTSLYANGPGQQEIPATCSKSTVWAGGSCFIPLVGPALETDISDTAHIVYADANTILHASCEALKLINVNEKKEYLIREGVPNSRCLMRCKNWYFKELKLRNKNRYSKPGIFKYNDYILMKDIWVCPGDIGCYLFIRIKDGKAIAVSGADSFEIKEHTFIWNDYVLEKDEIEEYKKTFWMDLIEVLQCCFD